MDKYPYPFLKEKPLVYYFWLNTVGRLLAYICQTKVIGAENLPPKGPVLITANHKSYLDPPLIAWALKKRIIFFMAKEELFKGFLGILIKHWGNAFPVKRGHGDKKAILTALKLLKNNKALCIFPEGTRAKNTEFLPPKLGAGLLALKAKVPILPVLIWGTNERPPKVTIVIGKVFKLDLEDKKENYPIASNVIMEKIKELKKYLKR